MTDEDKTSWLFDFGLEKVDGTTISVETAEELIDVIIAWAESNDCQIGGGYRRYDSSDE